MGMPLIFNIQKYSIHDGEGIRTTVFFKGCPLSCSWCHNPESQRFEAELLFHADRCTGCGACSQACPQRAVSMESLSPPAPALPGKSLPRLDRSLCQGCGACVPACPYGAREAAGKEYPLPELIRQIGRASCRERV